MFAKNILALLLVFGLATSALALEPVDINQANVEALAAAINGVGIKKAEAIVSYRNSHGPFRSVDELSQVQGIGAAIIEKSRANLKVVE